MSAASETYIIDCPEWCTEPHARNEFEFGDVCHRQVAGQARFGPVEVSQYAMIDGKPMKDAPVVYAMDDGGNGDRGEFTAAEARQYADALLRAADILDGISAVLV